MLPAFFRPRALFATVLAALLLLPASAVLAEKGLPKPHVSPALDAVLLPITAEVRREFKLGKKAAGVVVVSVDPGGVGELYGLEPGEVITKLDGKVLRRPVDIDSMIRYKLNGGDTYFFLEGTWKNRKQKTIIQLTNDDYVKPVAVEAIPRWRGYNQGGAKAKGKRGQGYRGDDGYYYAYGGFYYADFCDGYYTDFYEVYDYTLIYVEEIIVTEVYITSIESDETVFWYDGDSVGYDYAYDDYYLEEVDAYVYSEEFYAEYESTEVYYDDEAYDPETGLSYDEAAEYGYLEPETADEGFVDDGYVEDGAVDEGYVDDGYVEEGAVDEGYVDDGYVDDGAVEDTYVDEGYVDDGYVEETYVDEGYVDDGYVDDGYVDDGYVDDGYVDDGYVEETYVDEGYVDEGYVDDGYVDDGYVEEPVYEEPVYEEPVYEEPVYEEPVYEEPVYEEPVYEEPVYEEPVYDGGGGGCYYDEAGNEICG
jgi:hypothetical protein